MFLPLRHPLRTVSRARPIFADVAWKSRLGALSDAALMRFREAVAAAAQPYREGTRLRLTATSLCASAVK
jgi:hypothetical protein